MDRQQTKSFRLPEEIVNSFRGTDVLITGGQGYIGSALAQTLANIDCNLTLLDKSRVNAWMPQEGCAHISTLQGDISMLETWETVLPGMKYVFHLAALEYDRTEYQIQRDLEVNALPVLHLLEACRKHSLSPLIIFTSSANIFGRVEKCPVDEHMRDNPPSLWSIHKLIAENYLRLYTQQFGIPSVVLRLANVYGPPVRHEVISRVILNKMILRALSGETLTLFDNQNCLRDYIFLQDVINALLRAGTSGEQIHQNPFYIIGSGEGKTFAEVWRLIADKVKKRTGKDVPIRVDSSVPIEPIDCRDFVADTTRFRQVTGWVPQVYLEEGIERTLEAVLQANGR